MEGSRFIASAFPARDEASARAGIESIRAEFPDATHHCWAFAIQGTGPEPLERSHDAGEPAGTAGAPIGQAIRRATLVDTVVVVTRYFGGTLLGKGGLARAYRSAASLALASAPSATAPRLSRARFSVPLSLDGQARHLVARRGGRVEAAGYGEAGRSILDVTLPAEALDSLREDLSSLAKGDLDVTRLA